MKNSLLLILALCSASVLASPVDKSPSLPLQDSDEDLTPQVNNQLKNSDEDTSKPPTKDSISTVQGTTSTSQESYLQKVDGDMILDIFSRITFPDVLKLRATCKSMQGFSTETVETPFLENIRNYNRNYLRDQRLEPLLRQAFKDYDTDLGNVVRDARTYTSFPFNVRNYEQVLVECAQEMSTLSRCPKNEVKDRVVSALKQVEESFKNDEFDLDHNDDLEMELAVVSILHQRYAPILCALPSIEAAKGTAKKIYNSFIRDLDAEEKANIERGIVQTLGPDHEKILGLEYVLQRAMRDVKSKIGNHELQEDADVEAEMIALLVPQLEMDQDSVKKVFEQARWSVKLGFAVKYKLAHAAGDLLKSLEIFGLTTKEQILAAGPTIQRHYNAAIKTKCKPLIKAFEESGLDLVKTTEPETSG